MHSVYGQGCIVLMCVDGGEHNPNARAVWWGWCRFDDEEILATTVVLLASSTALLGVALWITGKLKLAGLVQ
jgi:hypothetical protein